MLLQRFAHHFGGKPGLQVFIEFDGFILRPQLDCKVIPQGLLLLQAFAGGLLQLVVQRCDLSVPLVQLLFFGLQRLLHRQLLVQCPGVQLCLQRRDLAVPFGQLVFFGFQRLLHGQLLVGFLGFQMRFQALDLLLKLCGGLLPRPVGFGTGQLQRVFLFNGQPCFPLLQLPVEFLIPHLPHNGGIAGFIHGKHFAASGTFDLVHRLSLPLIAPAWRAV